VFAESRQKAAEEHQALQTRIPTVQISIEGAAPSEVAVVADGKALESVLIGVPVAMNPGTREVQASRGEETVTETVTLAEGEKKTVVLRFSGSPAAAAPAAAPATAGTAPPTGPSPTTTRTARHR